MILKHYYDMKTFLKRTKYYAVLVLYYLVAFSLILFTYEPLNGERNIGGVGLFISLAVIVSPFLIVSSIITKFYCGDKKRQATGLAATIICFMILHVIGVSNTAGGLNSTLLPFYAFNTCLVISLFIYRPKIQ